MNEFVSRINNRYFKVKSEFIKGAEAKFRRYNNTDLENLLLALDIEDNKKLTVHEKENLYKLKCVEFLQNLKSDDTPDIETLHEVFFHECLLFIWSIADTSSTTWRFSCPHCKMINEVTLSISDLVKKYLDKDIEMESQPIELLFDMTEYNGKEDDKYTFYFKPFIVANDLNDSPTENGKIAKYIDYIVDNENKTIELIDDTVKEVLVNKLYPEQKDILKEAILNRNKIVWRKKVNCTNTKCNKPILPFSEDFVNFFVTQLVMRN
jgi:hypothetical protein